EALLDALVPGVEVRVQLLGQLAVAALDFLGAGVARHAEGAVKIAHDLTMHRTDEKCTATEVRRCAPSAFTMPTRERGPSSSGLSSARRFARSRRAAGRRFRR